MFQEREDRLKRHHNDEIKEWEDRVAKLQGEKDKDYIYISRYEY